MRTRTYNSRIGNFHGRYFIYCVVHLLNMFYYYEYLRVRILSESESLKKRHFDSVFGLFVIEIDNK